MAGELTFRCAVCGVEMKEANHWFMSWMGNGAVCFAHFDEQVACQPHMICLCGEVHCHTILSQRLSELAGGTP